MEKKKKMDGSDFNEENIHKAWDEFVRESGEDYLGGITVCRGKRRYDNCVIFLAYSRDERNDISSIESEARDFFKRRFGDNFYTTYKQCEYIRHECPAAFIAYC